MTTRAQMACDSQGIHGAGQTCSAHVTVGIQFAHGAAEARTSMAPPMTKPVTACAPQLPRSLTLNGPILADPTLAMCADVVDDLEHVRRANENRLRALTATGDRGHGLSAHHPDVARLAGLVDQLNAAEHQAVLNLQRAMRAHPLGPWVKSTHGVGEKQAARLLGQIRDPYWNDAHQRPRTLRELWAYCGLHVLHPGDQVGSGSPKNPVAGVAPYRARGQRANWNNAARMRVWLIATICVQHRESPYRAVYDATRDKYAEAVHNTPCIRCGPAGKPAPAGSPLPPGHQHARALRAMSKEILRDLWREAKRLHEQREPV